MERTSAARFPGYDDSQLTDFEPGQKLGKPGKYPFDYGLYPAAIASRAISALKPPAEDARRGIWGEYQPEAM
jgi:hypothetical protein